MSRMTKSGKDIFLCEGWMKSKNKGQEIQRSKIKKDEAKFTKLYGIRRM